MLTHTVIQGLKKMPYGGERPHVPFNDRSYSRELYAGASSVEPSPTLRQRLRLDNSVHTSQKQAEDRMAGLIDLGLPLSKLSLMFRVSTD